MRFTPGTMGPRLRASAPSPSARTRRGARVDPLWSTCADAIFNCEPYLSCSNLGSQLVGPVFELFGPDAFRTGPACPLADRSRGTRGVESRVVYDVDASMLLMVGGVAAGAPVGRGGGVEASCRLLAPASGTDRQPAPAAADRADPRTPQTGPVCLAGKGIAGHRASPRPRRTDRNRFASWTGTAPLEASFRENVRHRLSRAGTAG